MPDIDIALVVARWLVGRLPNVDEARRRVEAVEERQRQRHVAQQRPKLVACFHKSDAAYVVVRTTVLTVKVDAIPVRLVRFDLERLHDPHGQVAHNEERNELPTGFARLQLRAPRAPAQSVYNQRCL